MDLGELIEREQKKAKKFLREVFEIHYLRNVEKALRSGAIDISKVAHDDFTFVRVVFNILGTNQKPLTKVGESMKANLRHFIS